MQRALPDRGDVVVADQLGVADQQELLRPGDLLQGVHRPGHLGDLGVPAAVGAGVDGDPAVAGGGDARLDLQQVGPAVFGVPVGGGRVVLIGQVVGAVKREAGHVPVQLADVDAEGADRADRDRPGDLLQVRGDRIEGAAQLVVVQRERGDAQDLRDRPVAGPVLDVHQRRGRGEPVADHRLDGLPGAHGRHVADRHQLVDDLPDAQPGAEGGDHRQGTQHLDLPCRDIGPGQLRGRGGPAPAGHHRAAGAAAARRAASRRAWRRIQGAGLGLAGQPAADRGAKRARRQPVQEPAETRLRRREVAAGPGGPAGTEHRQRLLPEPGGIGGHRCRDGVPGQQGRRRDRRRRGVVVPDPAGMARITQVNAEMGAQRGDLRRRQVQPHRRRGRIEQHRRGRRPQGGQAAGAHLAQPAPLHLAVEGIPAPARAAGIPRGRPGAGEPGRGVARAGVPGRVGERLDRQHDLVVQLQVVAGQPGQRPGQHRRGQVRPPSLRQHAEPLLAGQHRQPVQTVGIRPADHGVPGGAPQHRRPVPQQRDPGAVQHRDVPDHRPEQARAEPVVGLQQLTEPGRLSRRHRPYRQIAGP